jgi:hypothetical protein
MVALFTREHSYEIVNNILSDLSIQQGAVLLCFLEDEEKHVRDKVRQRNK